MSHDLLLLFNVSFIKSWSCSNLMEIVFYLNQRLDEKKMQVVRLELGIFLLQSDALKSSATRDLQSAENF